MPALPVDLARRMLASAAVVRLATADAAGQPHVVVTTFVCEGDQIFTAIDQKPKSTRNLKRLRNIAENPRVAVLGDHYEGTWERIWWVRADGKARILTEATEMEGPIGMLAARYWQYRADRPEGPVIAVSVERWSGWSYAEPTSMM